MDAPRISPLVSTTSPYRLPGVWRLIVAPGSWNKVGTKMPVRHWFTFVAENLATALRKTSLFSGRLTRARGSTHRARRGLSASAGPMAIAPLSLLAYSVFNKVKGP